MTATTPAALAWAMMARAENPMPVYAARDWLCERADCEPAAAAAALAAAGAHDLQLDRPAGGFWNHTPSALVAALREGDCVRAAHLARIMRLLVQPHARQLGFPGYSATTWPAWCARADRAVELVRALQELPR